MLMLNYCNKLNQKTGPQSQFAAKLTPDSPVQVIVVVVVPDPRHLQLLYITFTYIKYF